MTAVFARFKVTVPEVPPPDKPVPAVTPTPTPSATAKAPAWADGSKTINCVKGKAKKTVSGFNPKCPKGFKKIA